MNSFLILTLLCAQGSWYIHHFLYLVASFGLREIRRNSSPMLFGQEGRNEN